MNKHSEVERPWVAQYAERKKDPGFRAKSREWQRRADAKRGRKVGIGRGKGRAHLPLAEKLALRSITEPNTGCLLWKGNIGRGGYGYVWHLNKSRSAHRASFIESGRTIPNGTELDHLCRTRSCINPLHLEPVTRQVNVDRGANAKRTHCKRGHPFDEKNTYTWKSGARMCRACRISRREIKALKRT